MEAVVLITPFFSRRADGPLVKKLEEAVAGAIPRSSSLAVASYTNNSLAESRFRQCRSPLLPCLAKTGKELGFFWAVTGYVDVSEKGDYFFNLKLVDTETARVERKKEMVIGNDSLGLTLAAEIMARQLFEHPLPPIDNPPVTAEKPKKPERAAVQGIEAREVEKPEAPNLSRALVWGGLGVALGSGVLAGVMGVRSWSKETEGRELVSQLEAEGKIIRTPQPRFADEESRKNYGRNLENLEEQSRSSAKIANYALLAAGLSCVFAGVSYFLGGNPDFISSPGQLEIEVGF